MPITKYLVLNTQYLMHSTKYLVLGAFLGQMGNTEDPDLTSATDIDNKLKKCLQRCDYQADSVAISQSWQVANEIWVWSPED